MTMHNYENMHTPSHKMDIVLKYIRIYYIEHINSHL